VRAGSVVSGQGRGEAILKLQKALGKRFFN
jgi:hypothetical protein